MKDITLQGTMSANGINCHHRSKRTQLTNLVPNVDKQTSTVIPIPKAEQPADQWKTIRMLRASQCRFSPMQTIKSLIESSKLLMKISAKRWAFFGQKQEKESGGSKENSHIFFSFHIIIFRKLVEMSYRRVFMAFVKLIVRNYFLKKGFEWIRGHFKIEITQVQKVWFDGNTLLMHDDVTCVTHAWVESLRRTLPKNRHLRWFRKGTK